MKWGRCDLLSADFLHKWWNHRSQRHHILIMLGSDCIQEGQRQALRRAHDRGDLLPLSSAALAVLAEVPEIGPHEGRGYIFTTDGEHPISGFSKFKREFDEAVLTVLREHDAGAKPIPNWTLHDLRRTARHLAAASRRKAASQEELPSRRSTPDRARARHAVGEGVRSCPRAGCGRAA